MWFNVWFIIWPNQKVALGIVEGSPEEKAASARKAMLFSRTKHHAVATDAVRHGRGAEPVQPVLIHGRLLRSVGKQGRSALFSFAATVAYRVSPVQSARQRPGDLPPSERYRSDTQPRYPSNRARSRIHVTAAVALAAQTHGAPPVPSNRTSTAGIGFQDRAKTVRIDIAERCHRPGKCSVREYQDPNGQTRYRKPGNSPAPYAPMT